ncbi:MAG: alpha/beta hydrolase [Planctomycetota bacterium JB042]
MIPPLLKKTAFACAVIYLGSLPASFVVGGFLFSRPLREPFQTQDLVDAMRPEWDRNFFALMKEVEIELRPRVRLRGTMLGAGSHATVVILHGGGRNRVDGLEAAYRLWDSGYDVLLLDRAAHGRSDGDTRPLFGGEAAELKLVVDALIQQAWGGTSKIGILGIGDAATSALVAAAYDPRIDAVCAENPALEATDFVLRSYASWAPLPSFLLMPHTVLAVAGMKTAVDVEASEFDASEALAMLSAPALILAVGADAGANARSVYDRLKFGLGALEEGPDRDSVYSEMCRFFDRQL